MFTIRSSRFKVPGSLLRSSSYGGQARFNVQRSAFSLQLSVLAALFLAAAVSPRTAADDVTTRLRESLRSTALQLRDAQNQIANLQGAQADSDAKNKALTDQLALIKKHSTDDKAAADAAIAGLTAKAADQAAEIEKLTKSLGNWKVACTQTATAASTLRAECDKLTDANIVFQRRVDYLEGRNVALFKLGNEILGRYEDFSLGNALAEKEPFVGVTRTKLENLVQDYQDKLLDQKATPAPFGIWIKYFSFFKLWAAPRKKKQGGPRGARRGFQYHADY
jgi:hypothetical protein